MIIGQHGKYRKRNTANHCIGISDVSSWIATEHLSDECHGSRSNIANGECYDMISVSAGSSVAYDETER